MAKISPTMASPALKPREAEKPPPGAVGDSNSEEPILALLSFLLGWLNVQPRLKHLLDVLFNLVHAPAALQFRFDVLQTLIERRLALMQHGKHRFTLKNGKDDLSYSDQEQHNHHAAFQDVK